MNPGEVIVDTPVAEEMRNSFLEYSMSVIVSRALPDVRDGMKPVHRRIMYSLHEQGIRPGTAYKKCARVVGDCFVAGALVSTTEGLVPVEEITVGDKVVDGAGVPSTVIGLYYNDPQPLTDVSISNGRTVTVTPGQRFRTLDPQTSEMRWTRADELQVGDRLLAPAGERSLGIFHDTAYSLGLGAAKSNRPGRRTPQSVLEDSLQHASYLAGAFDGAGASTEGGIGFTVPSLELAEDIQVLLSYNGIGSRIGSDTSFQVAVTGGDAAVLAALLAPLTRPVAKQEQLELLASTKVSGTGGQQLTGGQKVLFVSGVKASERNEKTYDFRVDSEAHEIVVDGIVQSNCMGKYHPHGDSAIYEALVRLAQNFSMRLPIVDGHGNFGSLDDPPAASRYCVTGDTRIRLADGTSPQIGELLQLDENSEKDLELSVLDHHGQVVTADKGFNSGKWPTLKVTTKAGFSIQGSENHPLLCLVEEDGKPRIAWRRLDEITPGTVVCMARNAGSIAFPSQKEYALGLLCGAWVSEGWASAERAGFNNCDKHYFDEVLHAYDLLVGGNRYSYSRTLERSGNTIYELDVQRAGMEYFAESPLAEMIGHKAAEKRIPEIVWNGSLGVKRTFLMSAFEGDGGPRLAKDGAFTVHYSTYSEQLGRELQELLLEFGVFASRHRYKRPTGVWEYRLIISGLENMRTFATRVGFLKTKQQKLEKLLKDAPKQAHRLTKDYAPYVAQYVRASMPKNTRGTGRHWLTQNNFDRMDRWENNRPEMLRCIKDPEVLATILPIMDSNYRFETVVSVEDSGFEEVYSIRVATEDHSFLAGGFVNHNTECRMAPAAQSLVAELQEDTVDFRPNYDGQEQEPVVLPAAFPNLLVNGGSGIAVGMATNMPPHNLVEVISGLRAMLDNPKITLEEMMGHIPGPDLPKGGIIIGTDMIREAYESGRGTFRMRALAKVEDVSARRKGIVVTELPYGVGPEKVAAKIKELQNQKRLLGVADVQDYSDRKKGLRLVIPVKTGFNPYAVLEDLYKYTPLEESFGINNVALVNGQPQTLGLLALCRHYLNHRIDVVTRRTKFRLRKAQARMHIVDGLLIALNAVDEVVAAIRSSRDTDTARKKLMREFKLSEIQASHILEMPLRRLTSLEVNKLKDEKKELEKQITYYNKLLGSEKEMRKVVGEELEEVSREHGDPRRTKLLAVAPDPAKGAESLEVPDDPTIVTLSASGLISRSESMEGKVVPFKGKHGRHDVVVASLATTNRAVIGGITDQGRLLRTSVIELPQAQGKNRGAQAREFFLELTGEERVVALVALPDTKSAQAKESAGILLATKQGTVKRITPDLYPLKSGQEIIGLKEGDAVAGVVALPSDTVDVVLVASTAQLLRTSVSSIRPQGRTAGGVAGMKVGEGEVIAVGIVSVESDAVLATVTNTGALKVSTLSEYPAKGRGGAGVRCHTFRKGEDRLVAAWAGEGKGFVLTAGNEAVALPAERTRRDASGTTTVEGEIVAIGAGRS